MGLVTPEEAKHWLGGWLWPPAPRIDNDVKENE